MVSPRRLLVRPIELFLQVEGSSGIVLVAAAAAAVVWANASANGYHDIWHWSHGFDIFTLHRHFTVHAFVNDGLMAVFFYLVGVEVKRELVEGELNTRRKAALPAIAALGGMLAPALIFTAFNAGGDGAQGWGIPMATDIAFAIGVLALLGTRVPFPLKVFLLALAIADDIGAILVIAVFYSSSINLAMLIVSIACLGGVAAALRRGLQQWPLFLVLGLGAWLAALESGVHATIAGVALGLLTSSARAGEGADSALDRIEHWLHPWVSYLIVPVFALANAGVAVSASGLRAAITSEIGLGIALGLLIGKPLGIVAASWLAVRTGVAALPQGLHWRQIIGAGMLGGIGFTVSLFITTLALESEQQITDAKLAIFGASIASGALGFGFLWLTGRVAGPAAAPAMLEEATGPSHGDEPAS